MSLRKTRSNRISPEAEPIAPAVASPEIAYTLARVRKGDDAPTLCVTACSGDVIEAIDLTTLGAPSQADAFEALASVGDARLRDALARREAVARYYVRDLLPSGAMYHAHVATGTNFAAHASETGSTTVFNFPKFGLPTPAVSNLTLRQEALMDYEVEISVQFDRDIRTMEDFHVARKGFFLCGDFTDRATLVRLIDPANVTSGRGFSDAKSGPGYFPTGPFLVVPHDWRTFVRDERIVTRVNGEVRQDARGAEMMLDFEALVAKALQRDERADFIYQGRSVSLLENGIIARGSAVMSGTSEGVIFMPPMRADIIGGLLEHVATGRFLTGAPLFASIGRRFIANERKSGRFLKPGDRVEHLSSRMGALSVDLVADEAGMRAPKNR